MEDIYKKLKNYFFKIDDVTVSDGKGAQGIKYEGKMFAMFYKGALTLKFDPKRVTELIENRKAEAYDPGTGKAMKDRVLIPSSQNKMWLQLAKESYKYVSKKK